MGRQTYIIGMLLQQTRLALLSGRLTIRAATEVVSNLSETLLSYEMSASCHVRSHPTQLLVCTINDVTYLSAVPVSLRLYM